MKNIIFLTYLISSFSCGQNTPNNPKIVSENPNDLLKQLVVEHKAVGVVAGISEGDSILWKSAYGHMDLKNDKKANTKMRTRIASIAKPMTAIAVMQLYEKGLIKLDDPIQTYIKEFANLDTKGITIRQLLNHTSGIKAYATKKEAKTSKNYNTLTKAMNVFINRSLYNKPGKEYHYSTYNYVVLGVLTERVSGERFEDYMKKNIWEKAFMNHTGAEKYGEIYDNKTKLYTKNKKGKIKKVEKENNLSNRIPGGGFYSTIEDILKFGQAVLNNTLIKQETLKMMLQDNDLRKEGNPYGIGWFMYGGKPNPETVFGHSGGQTGASSQLLIIPEQEKVIVVLANTSNVWEKVIGTAVGILNYYKKNN